MAITPVAGARAGYAPAAAKPESRETPGAPDNDRDRDNTPKPAARAAGAPGRVDVKG
jgi:hypothetical protein